MKIPNFKTDFFPFPTLTPVKGTPSYEDIRTSYRECIANANSVTTTLGGGEHGHQGLVMPERVYIITTGTPYKRPMAPTKPSKTTSKDLLTIQQEKDIYQDELDEHNFVNALERTIFAQLQAAYDHKVLLPKLDRKTGLPKVKIPELFQYLFKTYGNITAPALAAEKQAVLNHVYVHDDPLDVVFECILAYNDKAETFSCPESDEQLMHMATIILMNANIFADALQEWNGKDDLTKTWDNFQTFFIDYQGKYKEARSNATSSSAGFTPSHQAHLTTDGSATDHALAVQEAEAYNAYLSEIAKHQAEDPVLPQANATVSASNDLLTKLVEQVTALTSKVDNVDTNSNNKGKGKGKDKQKKKPRAYCWTHGACAHSSGECNNKAEGHKNDATFKNILGGSTKGCFWLDTDASA